MYFSSVVSRTAVKLQANVCDPDAREIANAALNYMRGYRNGFYVLPLPLIGMIDKAAPDAEECGFFDDSKGERVWLLARLREAVANLEALN